MNHIIAQQQRDAMLRLLHRQALQGVEFRRAVKIEHRARPLANPFFDPGTAVPLDIHLGHLHHFVKQRHAGH